MSLDIARTNPSSHNVQRANPPPISPEYFDIQKYVCNETLRQNLLDKRFSLFAKYISEKEINKNCYSSDDLRKCLQEIENFKFLRVVKFAKWVLLPFVVFRRTYLDLTDVINSPQTLVNKGNKLKRVVNGANSKVKDNVGLVMTVIVIHTLFFSAMEALLDYMEYVIRTELFGSCLDKNMVKYIKKLTRENVETYVQFQQKLQERWHQLENKKTYHNNPEGQQIIEEEQNNIEDLIKKIQSTLFLKEVFYRS